MAERGSCAGSKQRNSGGVSSETVFRFSFKTSCVQPAIINTKAHPCVIRVCGFAGPGLLLRLVGQRLDGFFLQFQKPHYQRAYELDLDVGLVLCGDGRQYSQGYGSIVDIAMDFPLLSLFKNGEKIGTGYVDADGVFHASASYTETGIRYDVTLDGKAAKSQITGEASAAVTPPIGSQCTLNTRFTAKPGKGA